MFFTHDNFEKGGNSTHMIHLNLCLGGSNERIFLNDYKSWEVEEKLRKLGSKFSTVTVFMHQEDNFDNAGEFQAVINFLEFEETSKKNHISLSTFIQNMINKITTEKFIVDTFVDFHDCIAL